MYYINLESFGKFYEHEKKICMAARQPRDRNIGRHRMVNLCVFTWNLFGEHIFLILIPDFAHFLLWEWASHRSLPS